MNCNICGKEKAKHLDRCEEHYRCDDCGSKTDLIFTCGGLHCRLCENKRIEHNLKTFTDNTDYTQEITCPYCGYVFSDSWECSDGENMCGDCEKLFEVTRVVTIDYCTEKIDTGGNNG